MDNQQILQIFKTALTTSTGGLVTTKQLNQFITTVIDMSDFLKEIRTEKGIATNMDLDRLGIDTRVLRKKIEDTEVADNKKAGFSRNYERLTPTEAILHAVVTYKWLKKAIGGTPDLNPDENNAAMQVVYDLIAKQFSNDLVDLIWNGDTSETGDDFLVILDGFVKKFKAHSYTKKGSYSASDKIKDIFKSMLATIPSQYRKNRDALRFYVNPDIEDAYRDEIGERNTGLGDILIVKNEPVYYKGVLIKSVWAVPSTEITLTMPTNLAIGFGQEMLVERDKDIKKQHIDVVVTTDIDCGCVIPDAIVQYSQE